MGKPRLVTTFETQIKILKQKRGSSQQINSIYGLKIVERNFLEAGHRKRKTMPWLRWNEKTSLERKEALDLKNNIIHGANPVDETL